MMKTEIVKKGIQMSKTAKAKAWEIAKSENTLAVIKVAATAVALVQAIEEYRKVKRPIGFRKK